MRAKGELGFYKRVQLSVFLPAVTVLLKRVVISTDAQLKEERPAFATAPLSRCCLGCSFGSLERVQDSRSTKQLCSEE